jgi:hypothetical protein
VILTSRDHRVTGDASMLLIVYVFWLWVLVDDDLVDGFWFVHEVRWCVYGLARWMDAISSSPGSEYVLWGVSSPDAEPPAVSLCPSSPPLADGGATAAPWRGAPSCRRLCFKIFWSFAWRVCTSPPSFWCEQSPCF